MFHPPQAAIGLALLPVAWAAHDHARAERGGSAPRERDADLARYFPPGWHRETVPDWPVVSRQHGVAARRLGSVLLAGLRKVARRMKGLVSGVARG